MSCNSFNVSYVVAQPVWNKNIEETGIGKTRLRDRVRVYKQQIKQPEHLQSKVEEDTRVWGRGYFKCVSSNAFE